MEIMKTDSANVAYDLSIFEPKKNGKRMSNSRPKPYLVKKKKPSREQQKAEQRLGARNAAKIVAFVSAFLIAISFLIAGRVQLTELGNKMNSAQNELSITKNQITILSMQVNSKLSLDEVELYASEKLGMVKQNSNQIEYINVISKDKVISSRAIDKNEKSE